MMSPRRKKTKKLSLVLAPILLILVIVWVLYSVNNGVHRPDVSAAPASPEPTSEGSSDRDTQQAQQQLSELTIRGEDRAGYARNYFGSGWADLNENRCDTRQEILQRDLDEITTADGCKVDTGTLEDPYTGETIEFQRGQESSMEVQIDHVVAAAEAWYSGAGEWDDEQRIEFFNDPENLLAVDGPANNAKGADDAANWLPGNAKFHCDYITQQISIKAKYQLSVDQEEHDAMRDVLATC